ncbi:MAG: glycosyltransferase [Caulobacteraceae bacterium]
MISVLIGFRNSATMTLRALQSIARQRLSGGLEIVLVDNRSEPAEARAAFDGARRLFGDGRVTLLSYDGPFNHSAQNNLAARAAAGEVVVICNNDVVLRDPAALEQLAAWALQDGIGTVGCRLEDPERGVGSYGHQFSTPGEDPFQSVLSESADSTFSGLVHACPGNTLALAAMARERFLAVGGLDETRFPVGYNDMDLMLRCSAAGLTHLYLGHVMAEHPRGSSRTGDNEDLQALMGNLRRPPGAHLRQLVRQRVETSRRRTPKPAAPAPDQAEAAALTAALEGAIEARRMVESERARIAAMVAGPAPGAAEDGA